MFIKFLRSYEDGASGRRWDLGRGRWPRQAERPHAASRGSRPPLRGHLQPEQGQLESLSQDCRPQGESLEPCSPRHQNLHKTERQNCMVSRIVVGSPKEHCWGAGGGRQAGRSQGISTRGRWVRPRGTYGQGYVHLGKAGHPSCLSSAPHFIAQGQALSQS